MIHHTRIPATWLRRKVPAHLRAYFGGRSEIVQALDLGAGQEGRALAAIQALDRQYDTLFLQAEKAYRAGLDPHAMKSISSLKETAKLSALR